MKNKTILFASVFAAMFFFGCEKEEVVAATDLPQSAKDFISTHFVGSAITSVVEERNILEKTYDVVLNNGTSLDFDKNGDCREIDGNSNKLPDSVIPTKLLEYVQANYKTDYIVSWEKDGKQQDIELSNQLELKFDKDSNFLRVEE